MKQHLKDQVTIPYKTNTKNIFRLKMTQDNFGAKSIFSYHRAAFSNLKIDTALLLEGDQPITSRHLHKKIDYIEWTLPSLLVLTHHLH